MSISKIVKSIKIVSRLFAYEMVMASMAGIDRETSA